MGARHLLGATRDVTPCCSSSCLPRRGSQEGNAKMEPAKGAVGEPRGGRVVPEDFRRVHSWAPPPILAGVAPLASPAPKLHSIPLSPPWSPAWPSGRPQA